MLYALNDKVINASTKLIKIFAHYMIVDIICILWGMWLICTLYGTHHGILQHYFTMKVLYNNNDPEKDASSGLLMNM